MFSSVKKERQSGIELLKIIAIFLIVVSHVSQSLFVDGMSTIGVNDYYIDLSLPTLSLLRFLLSLSRYGGTLGNTLFIGCTCWFLWGQKKWKFKKLIQMYLNTYIISMIFLLITSLAFGYSNLDKTMVFHSFLPVFFKNNWYITFYLMFCLIYPLINLILEKIGRIPHLVIAIALFTYSFIFAFSFDQIGSDKLVTWIAIYLVISYFRVYRPNLLENKKLSILMLISSFVVGIGLVVMHNIIGYYKPESNYDVLRFNLNHNPFTFIFAFSAINIFSKFKLSNKFINYISSLTLFVYLTHENVFFRQYFRLWIWEKIYVAFGFSQIFVWMVLYSIVLFVASVLVSFVYDKTINKLLSFIIEKISSKFSKKNA